MQTIHKIVITGGRAGQGGSSGSSARHLGIDEVHVKDEAGGDVLKHDAYGRAVGSC